ncbi:hypothetical protein [Rhodococcus koreensis]|uniref:hypothetical protein n=1 Tax=Rhodococcus koreensis TaxID=99653 RepID=UPI0036DA9A7C
MTELFIPKPAQLVAAAVVQEGLPSEFADVWVATKVPEPRRPRMVRATRMPGGGLTAHGATDTVRLLLECWGDDEEAAESLANVARAVLKASIGRTVADTFVRHWKEDGGPYPWPDESGQERWQLTGDLLLKVG